MKKLIPLLLIICCTLVSCSLKKEYDLYGKEQIEAFRNEAGSWQSGRYLLTNLDTGNMNQAFSFINNSDGSQTYLYEKVSDEGAYYAEYSGNDEFYLIDGDEVSLHKKGSDSYIAYDLENPHPYSTGGLLFYENLFVKSSEESTDEQGNITYTYTYNTEKINNALNTSLTKFVTTYTFDKNGSFLYFTQTNSNAEASYSYMIEIIDANTLTEIENPAIDK